jgi:hypothetical protein
MSVRRFPLSGTPCSIPHHLQVLLDETAELLGDWQGGTDAHTFVPADYVLVFDALCELRTRMPKGKTPTFLEWGSGVGIVTLMASALGWDAAGVEIQPGLVRTSLDLARSFDLPARFLEGSFFPQDEHAVKHCDRRIAEADLIYVYPWPDQEIEIFDLFDRQASAGAMLLTYYGIEDVRAFEKS